ncbi:hypothetical protein [Streptomyces sp. 4N124]|uniref:hypothetical protein n=1 Tax=Streptomyces sp. 4N124 TaxID=3457420 RepID=UPI003FCF5785
MSEAYRGRRSGRSAAFRISSPAASALAELDVRGRPRPLVARARPSLIDEYRLYLHHRWMERCTNASALTREIEKLGYRGDVNTVRRRLRPYRTGVIPRDAPVPQLTVYRVTDWIMRRPEQLTDIERKCLDDLCERGREELQ